MQLSIGIKTNVINSILIICLIYFTKWFWKGNLLFPRVSTHYSVLCIPLTLLISAYMRQMTCQPVTDVADALNKLI